MLVEDKHPQSLDPNPLATARAPVDVVMIAYNEHVNLPYSLGSVVAWANKVYVVDSGSTDGTQDLARRMGAQVVEHPWEGYARQKNWALDNLPLQSPWVLIIDADESITPKLRDEILQLCNRPPDEIPESGFFINRSLVFLGKRIRHCGYFPSWNLRLFKRGLARYEDRAVHEHMVLDGRPGYLKNLLDHEDRRGLEYYIAKHNRYSTLEAETVFYGEHAGQSHVKPSLFGNAVERRRFLRVKVLPKLPANWLFRFLWMFLFQLGFLDGMTGLRFCLFISSHELFSDLKLQELRRRAREAELARLHVPPTTEARIMTSAPQRPQGDGRGEESAGQIQHADQASQPVHAPPVDLPRAADIPDLLPPDIVSERLRSPWSLRQNLARLLWMLTCPILFRASFHNWYGWRRLVLRCFGATIGKHVAIRPSVSIEAPWNLDIGDYTIVGDHAILYALDKIRIGRWTVVSQYAHLCAGTHDYQRRTFPLVRRPVSLGDEVWVAADAFVGPGVSIGDRSVVAARSTVIRDVPPDQVVAGSPARIIKPRVLGD